MPSVAIPGKRVNLQDIDSGLLPFYAPLNFLVWRRIVIVPESFGRSCVSLQAINLPADPLYRYIPFSAFPCLQLH